MRSGMIVSNLGSFGLRSQVQGGGIVDFLIDELEYPDAKRPLQTIGI
jgi:hypothetical protein